MSPLIAPTEVTTDIVLRVRGTVQGVGFRPFVHRVATRLGLSGWVRNDRQGVLIRAVGPPERVGALEHALREELPPAAHILTITELPGDPALPRAGASFLILDSDATGPVEAAVPPDLALCPDCRAELRDPADRRFRYPFINCTQCGPRYSIVEALPYDRPQTTMRSFRMCPECQAEYDDPSSRRFHAQPNACPQCGPQVSLIDAHGAMLARGNEAILAAAQRIIAGGIVAVKGVGGYHLWVDATNAEAVAGLRRRKQREEKPFAVMFADLAAVEAVADVPSAAATLLASSAAPIVLVVRRDRRATRGSAPFSPTPPCTFCCWRPPAGRWSRPARTLRTNRCARIRRRRRVGSPGWPTPFCITIVPSLIRWTTP